MSALQIQESEQPKIFVCKMKSRQEMERDIAAHLLGWWHDILPGAEITLREATQEDIDRSWIRSSAPKKPRNYMVELGPRGCLILKDAIKEIKERL